MIKPSASLSISPHSFTGSSLKAHFPDLVLAQDIHATHGCFIDFPTFTICVSIPSSLRTLAISLKAVYVQPFSWGLALIINTFIISAP